LEVATHADADCVVSGTVGAIGFVRRCGRWKRERVALANKETLVMAGELMTPPRQNPAPNVAG